MRKFSEGLQFSGSLIQICHSIAQTISRRPHRKGPGSIPGQYM
jgi:hypothetical protein